MRCVLPREILLPRDLPLDIPMSRARCHRDNGLTYVNKHFTSSPTFLPSVTRAVDPSNNLAVFPVTGIDIITHSRAMASDSPDQPFFDAREHQPPRGLALQLAILKPSRGEGRGSALEWIDTVLGWFAFIALALPVFASATLYLWADGEDNPYPLPGTVSMVRDAVWVDAVVLAFVLISCLQLEQRDGGADHCRQQCGSRGSRRQQSHILPENL